MTHPVSRKAGTLVGSEIIRLAAEIAQKIREGNHIHNMTIGDFNPTFYPIPELLEQEIVRAYGERQTNYPPGDGMAELKTAVLNLLKQYQGLDYGNDEILIYCGARPAIYCIYQTILDPGDKVIYPIPSWNNNHYTHLSDSQRIEVITQPENGFMPVREELEPYVQEAALLALCSPLNPTGTVFGREQLGRICDLILEENHRRNAEGRKPLYVIYDQIYWMLTMDGVDHVDPVSLRPEMREYTLFVDGISKAFAATGVRVGWSLAPADITARMKSVNSHIGAWAPKAEQVATARFLSNHEAVDGYLSEMRRRVNVRFEKLYEGFLRLKENGFPVEVIAPQGAIYLTVRFALKGYVTESGEPISTVQDISAFLLDNAQLAIVPFTAFGASDDTDWFRVSVGTCDEEEIPEMFQTLETALDLLSVGA